MNDVHATGPIGTNEIITLRSNVYEVAIAPRFGGALLHLRTAGQDLLRPASSLRAAEKDPRNSACFPCAPYFGRIRGGVLARGESWPLGPTLAACDAKHALHGEGWVSPWTVVSASEQALVCRFVHDGRDAGRFPFAYVAEQRFSVSDRGLSVTLAVTNADSSAMPAAPGLHPFFARAATTSIRFTADGFWAPPLDDAEGLHSAIPRALDFASGAPLPRLGLDHSYTKLRGRVRIETEGACIEIKTDAPHLHLFAPQDEPFFCAEPITGLPGAHAPLLAPGETRAVSMSIALA